MTITPNEKIDWFRVIADLCAKGYTHTSIAVAVNGVNYNTVRYWRDGGAPRYEDGEQLIQLWCNVTGKCKEIIPRLPHNPPAQKIAQGAKL
jgi:hypothetical protein